MVAEHLLDRHRLGAVIELRRAGVRVDVINLFRREAGISERIPHRANARFAARQRRGHVEGVVVQTVTEHFRQNVRAALLRMLQLLDHERRGAFSHDESVALEIERPASQGGIAGPLAHRFDDGKGAKGEGTERRFGAPGHDHVREVVSNVTKRFSDRDRAAGATV